jgi:lysophospholipase L1-like esterase
MKLACLGDSLTECRVLDGEKRWTKKLSEKLGAECVNYGLAGDTTGGMLARCQRELMKSPFTHCFIMGGTNDTWFGEEWQCLISNTFAMIRHAQFLKIVPIIGIPPLFVIPGSVNDPYALYPPVDGYDGFIAKMKDYREQLIRLCRSESLCCADVFSAVLSAENREKVDSALFLNDGLHFNESGCEIVADSIAAACCKHGIV